MAIETINPATEELVKKFTPTSDKEVKIIIDQVDEEFQLWKNKTYAERKVLMLKTAEVLRSEKQHYAEILTLEMGKPIKQAIAEVEKCAWVCEYYAENTESILEKEFIKTDASTIPIGSN